MNNYLNIVKAMEDLLLIIRLQFIRVVQCYETYKSIIEQY